MDKRIELALADFNKINSTKNKWARFSARTTSVEEIIRLDIGARMGEFQEREIVTRTYWIHHKTGKAYYTEVIHV